MALQPFSWGANGQKATPSSVKKQADIAAALAARGGAPQNLGEGLNRIGEALLANSYSSRAAAGEEEGAASRKALMDALMGNPDPTMADIAAAMGNEWVTSDPGSSAVLQALMGAEIQQNDPLRQQQLQMGQIELENAPLDAEYRRAQIDALTAKPAVPPTDDMREYEMAKTQGFAGSLQDWIAAKPTAGGVTVNTGDNSSAFGKKADETAATRMSDLVTSGQGAAQFMGDIQALAALGGQIDTGKGAEILNTLGPYAQALGVKLDGLSEGQAYQAIIDRMAPAMRPAGSGASSDFDARQFLSSLPSLGRTPEGNQIIMQTLSAMQQHKIAAAEIAGRALSGDITWQAADKEIAALGDPFTAFNEYGKQASGEGKPVDPKYEAPEPPEGWGGDAALWRFMSPEDRALW